jgi:CBS domain-containing protein
MRRNEPVTHLMSTHILSVQRGQPASMVRQIMGEKGFHHVPVLDGKKLVGMISTMDLVRLSWGANDPRSLDSLLDHTVKLEEIMTTDPVCLSATQTVRDAAELLGEGSFHAALA